MRIGFAFGIVLVLLLGATASRAQQATDWSGPYVAATGGYASGTSTQNDNGVAPVVAAAMPLMCPGGVMPIGGMCPIPLDGNYRVSGGFGGAGLGYSLQTGRLVYGVEGDIGGGSARGSGLFCGMPTHACGTDVTAMADVRARVGYVFGKVLPYVTGGLAVDNLHAFDGTVGGHGSGWKAGYSVGAGIEYKITARISVRAEYLHTEIGSSYLFDSLPGVHERVGVRMESARVSLVFFPFAHDPAPVVARY